MAQPFTTLPVLPLSQALDPETKPKFLADLRSALLNVGFLYLSETGLPDQLIKDVIRQCGRFFEALPLDEKEKIEMKNEKSFLGWSRVSRSISHVDVSSVLSIYWRCQYIGVPKIGRGMMDQQRETVMYDQ